MLRGRNLLFIWTIVSWLLFLCFCTPLLPLVVVALATQWRPIPGDPIDCSPPGSSIHGILQARTLEWVAIPFSRGSSWPRHRSRVSCIAGRFFTIWVTREVLLYYGSNKPNRRLLIKVWFSNFSVHQNHLEALFILITGLHPQVLNQ